MAKFSAKDAAALGISTAGLAVSSANFINNSSKRKSDLQYQDKQLEAYRNLTQSLNRVDKALKEQPLVQQRVEKQQTQRKRKFGLFSHTGDLAYKGALLGGSITGLSTLLPKTKLGFKQTQVPNANGQGTHQEFVEVPNPNERHPKFRQKYNEFLDNPFKNLLITVGGIAIGATLGALAGAVMDISQAVSRKTTVNNRLMKEVLENLKRAGYREGQDYTRDPKMADLLKTRVCLVISRSSDSLRLLINTVKDNKLEKISGGVVKNLPTHSKFTEKASDRYNELNITTLTTNNGDATWVASVAERFIGEGYPVYLVEVG